MFAPAGRSPPRRSLLRTVRHHIVLSCRPLVTTLFIPLDRSPPYCSLLWTVRPHTVRSPKPFAPTLFTLLDRSPPQSSLPWTVRHHTVRRSRPFAPRTVHISSPHHLFNRSIHSTMVAPCDRLSRDCSPRTPHAPSYPIPSSYTSSHPLLCFNMLDFVTGIHNVQQPYRS